MKVFISYRRDGGLEVAARIANFFAEKNYSVFFDIDSMRLGPFPKQILDNIENSDVFIAVLTPHSLDRCENENDWVRVEIETALKNGISIIPFVVPGFSFPDILPSSIDKLREYQAVEYNAVLFRYVLEDLEKKMIPNSSMIQQKENINIKLDILHCCRAEVDYFMQGRICPKHLENKVGYHSFNNKDDVPAWFIPALVFELFNLNNTPILLDMVPTIEGEMYLSSGKRIDSIGLTTFMSEEEANKPIIVKSGDSFKGRLMGEHALLIIQAFNNAGGQLQLSINGNILEIPLSDFYVQRNYCKNIIGSDYTTIRNNIDKYFTV